MVHGDEPKVLVYEDEHVFGILDHAPLCPGHTLIIPKAHYVNLDDLAPPLIAPLFGAAQRVAHAVKGALGADGYHVSMNNGEHARQVVFHAHVHIIPRWADDGMTFMKRIEYASGQRDEVAAKIRAALKG